MTACLKIFTQPCAILAILLTLACPAFSQENASETKPVVTAKKEGKRQARQDRKVEQSEHSSTGTSTNVQMRMTGSLCIGCLVELEKKLKLMPGITRAKVDIPGHGGFYDGYSGPGASGVITATMSYDPNKISMDQVEDFIRTQGYTLRKVIER